MKRRVGKTLSPEEAEKKTRYLYWWLLTVIIFEYARPAMHLPILGLLPLNSMLPLLLFLVSFFAPGLRSWSEIRRDSMWIWPFIFVTAIMLSVLWADVKTYAFDVFQLTLGYLFLFIMIVRIVTTPQRLRGVFITLIGAHVFLIAMNHQILTDPSTRHYILGSTFLGDGNDFSMSLSILIALTIELALRQPKKWKRVFLWCVLALIMVAIIGTQSRGGSLGLGAVLAYLWWRSPRKAVGIVAIGFAVIGLLAYAPSVYFDRMGTLSNAQEESSANARIMAWKAGTRMAMSNALGVGAGNFPNNFPKYRTEDAPARWITAHSMYFLILGELGVLGLLMWLKMLFGNILANNKLRRLLFEKTEAQTPSVRENIRTLDLLNASVLGMVVTGAFLSVTYYPHIFMICGMLLCARTVIATEAGIDLSHPATSHRDIRGRSRAQGSAIASK